MARTASFWTSLRTVFDPEEVLTGEHARLFYCEREHSPVEDMCMDFDPAVQPLRPPIAFLAGHRGSGKSTLLLRFLERQRTDYFVVYFDIQRNLDSAKANQIDLLFLLGTTIFQVATQEGLAPEPQLLRDLAAAVYTITYDQKEKVKDEALNVTELAKGVLCFGATALGGNVGEKLAEALLKPFSFTSGITEEKARSRQVEPQVQEIVNKVNLIVADVHTRAAKPVLVAVDGLDKLQRLDQARLIFLESGALTAPICRIIYTVPMLIYTSPRFGQVEEECRPYFLANVKLHDRLSGARYDPGYATMLEVLNKRLRSMQMTASDVFEDEAVERLIRMSGGVMRWFVGLVQDAFKAAQYRGLDRVNREAAAKAIGDRVADLTGRLTTTFVDELKQVRKNKRPSGSEASSELLHGLFIVAYRNDLTWYDVHPLLWDALPPGE